MEMIEQSLERRIVGGDEGYDSEPLGKEQQSASQWLKHDEYIDKEYCMEFRHNEALYITQYS